MHALRNGAQSTSLDEWPNRVRETLHAYVVCFFKRTFKLVHGDVLIGCECISTA